MNRDRVVLAIHEFVVADGPILHNATKYGEFHMSFIVSASLAAAVYLTARPFVRLRFLKKDVEDDLRDYYRWVDSLRSPLVDIMLVLRENRLLDEERHERFATAYASVKNVVTWDDVALADRLVVEAMDDAFRILDATENKFQADLYREAKMQFNTTDENLINVRRLLHRDIPRLNGSFIHKIGLLRRLMKVPTYPMSLPVQWYAEREPGTPRWITMFQARAPMC